MILDQILEQYATPYHHDEDDGPKAAQYRIFVPNNRIVNIVVTVAEWRYSRETKESTLHPLDEPQWSVFLHHSCDEWVIAGMDNYGGGGTDLTDVFNEVRDFNEEMARAKDYLAIIMQLLRSE